MFKYQGKSVIDIEQQLMAVCVQKIGTKSINISYQQRDDDEMRQCIGKYLLDMIKVIPEGCLVFFTSYLLMSKFIENWTKNRIFN